MNLTPFHQVHFLSRALPPGTDRHVAGPAATCPRFEARPERRPWNITPLHPRGTACKPGYPQKRSFLPHTRSKKPRRRTNFHHRRTPELGGRRKKLGRWTNFHQRRSSELRGRSRKLRRRANFHHRRSSELGGPGKKLRRRSYLLRRPDAGPCRPGHRPWALMEVSGKCTLTHACGGQPLHPEPGCGRTACSLHNLGNEMVIPVSTFSAGTLSMLCPLRDPCFQAAIHTRDAC